MNDELFWLPPCITHRVSLRYHFSLLNWNQNKIININRFHKLCFEKKNTYFLCSTKLSFLFSFLLFFMIFMNFYFKLEEVRNYCSIVYMILFINFIFKVLHQRLLDKSIIEWVALRSRKIKRNFNNNSNRSRRVIHSFYLITCRMHRIRWKPISKATTTISKSSTWSIRIVPCSTDRWTTRRPDWTRIWWSI